MNLRTLAAFVISLAAAGAVSAQSVTLQAKIPFSFAVNGKTLPAGEYVVFQGSAPGTMMIRGAGNGAGALTRVVPPAEPSAHTGTARLVFNRYGERYFLSQIWTGADQGSQVPVTRTERELIAHRNDAKQEVVAALRSAD
jgi:hypothetical protein